MSEERDILEDLKINRFKLEDEAENQPSLFYHYSEIASEARENRDKAKAKLKETEARIGLDYRSGKRVSEAKLTEASIAAAVDTDPEVMEARKKYLSAEAELGKAVSAEEAMQQRKAMIGHLVQLYTMQYYSKPHGSRGDGAEAEASDAVNDALNRKKGEE